MRAERVCYTSTYAEKLVYIRNDLHHIICDAQKSLPKKKVMKGVLGAPGSKLPSWKGHFPFCQASWRRLNELWNACQLRGGESAQAQGCFARLQGGAWWSQNTVGSSATSSTLLDDGGLLSDALLQTCMRVGRPSRAEKGSNSLPKTKVKPLCFPHIASPCSLSYFTFLFGW